MFEAYKNLISKDAKQEKQEPLISKCFRSIIKPYRTLFGNSDKKPLEEVKKDEVSKKLDKPAKAEKVFKPPVIKSKLRSGKVLWSKK